jgi:polysaccharide biosynthesis protein PslH
MKIFILLSRVPYPLEKGDKLRAFNQLKYLSRNHEIHLCALNDAPLHPDAINAIKPYTKSIHILRLPVFQRYVNTVKAFFSLQPFQVGYFYNSSNQRIINNLIEEIKPDRIFCQLIRVSEYVRDININKTLDYQDVFSKGMERRAQSAPILLRPFFYSEYKRLFRYENEIFDHFNHKTIISYPDREHIPHPYKEQIAVIPNGVDQHFFHPMELNKDIDVVFTGNMAYPPNVNSVEFLAGKIFPLVLEKIPNAKLMIAGASPSARILAYKSPNIIITGWVDDIRSCYAQSKIFVAPMRIGTGLQNKLLEAMSMNVPCITSELANNALGAKPGEEIIIGNSPEEYAAQIINLLANPEKAKKIAGNAGNFVKTKYNWDTVNQKLETLICS